jgi:hypothetical protein
VYRPGTRLTNAFSKKLENHEYAVALNFFAYNFSNRSRVGLLENKGFLRG